MDPNLFHLDWDRTAEVLAAIVLLSFLIERALSPFFESARYIAKLQQPFRTGPAACPGIPNDSQVFPQYFSDHYPVVFRATVPSHDDDN